MNIKVLYFAAIRELAGRAEESIDVPDTVTTLRAFSAFLEQHVPALEGQLASVRWAQNEEFTDLDAPLREGDVIAAIPPVAGGA